MSNSILQDSKYCLFCGTSLNLHKHHCWHGSSNRTNAEKYGLWVWLCAWHHEYAPEAPHKNHDMDLKLMQLAESEYIRQGIGTKEDFIKVFGKNVLP